MNFTQELERLMKELEEELVKLNLKQKSLISRINQLDYIRTTKKENLDMLFKDLEYLQKKSQYIYKKDTVYAVDIAVAQATDYKAKEEKE